MSKFTSGIGHEEEDGLGWDGLVPSREDRELEKLRTQLTAAQTDRDQYKEWWETSCQHVKEALELLGVDVSVEGYVPDSWTLREQCQLHSQKLAALSRAEGKQ